MLKLDDKDILPNKSVVSDKKKSSIDNKNEISKEFIELREDKLWEEQGKIAKEAYDVSDSEIEKDAYDNDYKEFDIVDKIILSKKLKHQINSVGKGKRGNYRVPEPEKIKGVSVSREGKVRIAENWKPGTDGAKQGTRHMEIVKAIGKDGKPTLIDRVGSENGNYFSPMNDEGKPYSLKERAIGDYLPEENIQDNDSYHLYEVKQDFTRKNFIKAIKNTYTGKEQRKLIIQLDDYYYDATRKSVKNGHPNEKYCNCSIEEANGVKTGEIDQMFLEDDNEYGKGTDGGGIQYITPFNVEELKKMKMIKEI